MSNIKLEMNGPTDLAVKRGGKLYNHISNEIMDKIHKGVFQLGEKLPSEAELVEKYKVSVTTVRKSLSTLEHRGVIRREQGRGSFVSLQSAVNGTSEKLQSAGFIFEQLGRPYEDPVGSQILLSFANASCRKSVRLFLAETDFDANLRGQALIKTFEGVALDGVMVFLHEPHDAAERLAILANEFRSVVLFVPGQVKGSMPFDCIDVDVQIGMQQLMEYLLALGHRRIAYVGPFIERCLEGDERIGMGRFQTYHKALVEAGIELDRGFTVETPFRSEPGPEIAKAVVDLVRGANPVTAIATYNDTIASFVMNSLLQEGIRVPQDVSVTGWDDIPLAKHLAPSLSTVAFPYEQAANAAIDLMHERIIDPSRPVQKVTFPTKFIARNSVRVIAQ